MKSVVLKIYSDSNYYNINVISLHADAPTMSPSHTLESIPLKYSIS